MSLKTVVEDITTVEEAYRGLYELKDGKHVLAVEGVDDHPTVAGMKSAFGKTKDEIAKLKDQFKGIDPKKYLELVELQKKLESDSAGNDPEKLRKLVVAEYEPKLTELASERDDYKRRFHGVAKTDRVRTAALKAGVIPEDLEDVIHLTERNFDLDEKSMKVIVKGEDGTATGQTLEEYFGTTFKTAKPKYFVAAAGIGGGAGGGGGGGAGGGGPIKLTKAQGEDVLTYRAAKAKAEKEGRRLEIEG